MGSHLVLVGGGHAHMSVLKQLSDFVRRGHRVTLVSPSDYHYYSGMGPGLLAGTYRPDEVRFHIRRMATERGAAFVAGEVVRIDPARRTLLLAEGGELGYDVASFNTGSSVATRGIVPLENGVVKVKPIVNLVEVRSRLLQDLPKGPMRLVVAGGGPAGTELSGNLWRLVRDAQAKADLTLVAGHRLLAGFPGRVRKLALKSLAERKVKVLEGRHLQAFSRGTVTLDDGRGLPCDLLLWAVGVEPSKIFAESGLPVGEDGGLLVDDFLRSVAWPELFGGGDCICFQSGPLPKVGVFAVRQNPVLFHNLLAVLEGGTLQRFVPQKHYMLILNLGDGNGVLHRSGLVLGGRFPFRLKDWIDRRFMARFQVCGEKSDGSTVAVK